MKLQRYIGELRKQGAESAHDALYGSAFYHVADVDALLARIRAAVDAERGAERNAHQCDCPFGWCDERCPTIQSRKALDALLADGGE